MDLRSIADNTTSTVIALLLLLAIGVLIYGLARAIVVNRRTQVVVADLVAPAEGELARSANLSPVLRQYVRRDIQDQRKQAQRVGEEILRDASPDLEPQLRKDAVDNIQRTVKDSVGALSAALRAVAPEQADRFLGLFSILLPPPRGMSVTVTLLERGSDNAPRPGTAVEVAWLDGHPVATTTFWDDRSASSSATAAPTAIGEGIFALLEPISRWVAVRLVVELLASPSNRSISQGQGLGRLLTGGLFLAAMRDFPSHALAFGEQARDELEEASKQMPDLPLPIATLAGVHERIGWAHRAAGNAQQASDEFRAAVRLWQKAENLTAHNDVVKLIERIDRRLKAQLDSGHPGLRSAALKDLAGLDPSSVPPVLRSDPVWLYNRACLYAQASEANSGGGYQQEALRWLGLALIGDPDPDHWAWARQDPELAPIREVVNTFLINLQNAIPAQLNEGDAEALVTATLARSAH
jgi:hypothetical protein